MNQIFYQKKKMQYISLKYIKIGIVLKNGLYKYLFSYGQSTNIVEKC